MPAAKLTPIISPILQTPHGFFTRIGGVSKGLYASLNCGRGSGDHADSVAQNRAQVAGFFNIAPDALCGVYQTHSAEVATITEPTHGTIKADALVTSGAGLALGILTADCAPILFCDARAGVIGAAHAGWKGALFGVIENTVAAMVKLGATRGGITAVVGPSISASNYQVGVDFYDNFTAQDTDYKMFFEKDGESHYRFDLPKFCLFRLARAGVETAESTAHCTYERATEFYSYRRATHRNEGDYGRQISVILNDER